MKKKNNNTAKVYGANNFPNYDVRESSSSRDDARPIVELRKIRTWLFSLVDSLRASEKAAEKKEDRRTPERIHARRLCRENERLR